MKASGGDQSVRREGPSLAQQLFGVAGQGRVPETPLITQVASPGDDPLRSVKPNGPYSPPPLDTFLSPPSPETDGGERAKAPEASSAAPANARFSTTRTHSENPAGVVTKERSHPVKSQALKATGMASTTLFSSQRTPAALETLADAPRLSSLVLRPIPTDGDTTGEKGLLRGIGALGLSPSRPLPAGIASASLIPVARPAPVVGSFDGPRLSSLVLRPVPEDEPITRAPAPSGPARRLTGRTRTAATEALDSIRWAWVTRPDWMHRRTLLDLLSRRLGPGVEGRPDGGGASASRSAPSAPLFTETQGQYLAFIHAYSRISKEPPTEADVRRYFGVTAPAVRQMVVKLEKAGLLRRDPAAGGRLTVLLEPRSVPALL